MIIDFHAHVGDFRYNLNEPWPPLTWEDLIKRLDKEGIDKAVFLPVYNASPERVPAGILCGERMSVPDQVIDAGKYSDRIIPFTNLDPRNRDDFTIPLEWAREHGCVGVGEIICFMDFDDRRAINMFKQIGQHKMIITVETGGQRTWPGFFDDPGSPRLEKVLQECPETVIIGHGPGFWAEIGPVTSPEEKCYPIGPVAGEGSLSRLFRKYSNLYADISAGSAFKALTRDPEFGIDFINEFHDKLLFGTDVITCGSLQERQDTRKRINDLLEIIFSGKCPTSQEFASIPWCRYLLPQLDYLKALLNENRISREIYDNICWNNAKRLLADAGCEI